MALHGVDIASYQKDMDCSKVKADFIIIKATQGNTYVNPNCNRQYAQAKSAGKLLGLYHYATGIGPEIEADFFINNIKNYVKEAILCLDWEHNEKGGKNPVFNTAGEVDYVYRFMQRVHEKTGVYPLLYMSASVTRRRDWSKVAQICELWDAQYASSTKITDYQENPWRDKKGLGAWKEPPAIHQYSSCGSIDGYRQTSPGKLDMDIAYISKQDWMTLAKGNYVKPVNKSYSVGQVYTLQNNMYIRREPNGEKLRVDELTKNGKANAFEDADGNAVIKRGTRVTCKEVRIPTKAIWMRIPSGWICAKSASGKVFIT